MHVFCGDIGILLYTHPAAMGGSTSSQLTAEIVNNCERTIKVKLSVRDWNATKHKKVNNTVLKGLFSRTTTTSGKVRDKARTSKLTLAHGKVCIVNLDQTEQLMSVKVLTKLKKQDKNENICSKLKLQAGVRYIFTEGHLHTEIIC
jgi:hypothetical protein